MSRKLKSDKLLFGSTFLLVGIGVVMVYSASAMMAMDRFGQQHLFLTKQMMWAMLGFAVLAVVMRIDYHVYNRSSVIWTSLVLVIVALTAVLFMPEINNTRRWFGIAGIGMQPSELSKLALILFLAALLERRMDDINNVRATLLPIAIVLGAILTLVLLEPDFGTAMAIAAVAASMLFVAGFDLRWLGGLALAALPFIYLLMMRRAYRRRRIFAFLNPWGDPLGDGFQIIQSLIAVGTGGIAGRGLMEGVQKLFYLPEPHTDFIYAVVGEELGLVGSVAVLLCFAVFTWRGLRASMRAPDRFGALLALGLTMMVAVQAFVNMSVVLGLLPTKGIPLPFVSAGGSSLLISLVGVGVLLNVSQHASA